MHFTALKMFCDVARLRSFSEAARANDVTQSAVSQLVSQLERRVDAQLIDRSTRPLRLTPPGQTFYEGCKTLLRLYTELALRAKGVLMMRESGFDVPVDEATREKFAELRYLEKSVGSTGRLALAPMLHMSHKDLWQLYMLGK